MREKDEQARCAVCGDRFPHHEMDCLRRGYEREKARADRLTMALIRARCGLDYNHYTNDNTHCIGSEQDWTEEDCPLCSTDPRSLGGAEPPAGPSSCPHCEREKARADAAESRAKEAEEENATLVWKCGGLLGRAEAAEAARAKLTEALRPLVDFGDTPPTSANGTLTLRITMSTDEYRAARAALASANAEPPPEEVK